MNIKREQEPKDSWPEKLGDIKIRLRFDSKTLPYMHSLLR